MLRLLPSFGGQFLKPFISFYQSLDVRTNSAKKASFFSLPNFLYFKSQDYFIFFWIIFENYIKFSYVGYNSTGVYHKWIINICGIFYLSNHIKYLIVIFVMVSMVWALFIDKYGYSVKKTWFFFRKSDDMGLNYLKCCSHWSPFLL